MSVACRVVLAACLSLSAALPASAGAAKIVGKAPNPQYVLISFDSAHDIAQWKRSRALAARTGAHFTYFLSCVFLLSSDNRRDYRAPGKAAGRSNIGFAQSKQEVADRLEQINLALAEGHEMGSHACGHFDGAKWSRSDWLAEFDAFSRVLREAYSANGLAPEPAGWQHFAETGIRGFRAPYLATGKALYDALAAHGFAYDASAVSRGPVLPEARSGVERFALPQIPEGPNARRVIAMDYNLFVRHSGGFNRPDEAAEFQARTYDAFKAAFDAQYSGDRVPLQLGFHFTLMNDGAYWKALEQFAGEVCVRPDVVCTSYSDYLAQTAETASVTGAGG